MGIITPPRATICLCAIHLKWSQSLIHFKWSQWSSKCVVSVMFCTHFSDFFRMPLECSKQGNSRHICLSWVWLGKAHWLRQHSWVYILSCVSEPPVHITALYPMNFIAVQMTRPNNVHGHRFLVLKLLASTMSSCNPSLWSRYRQPVGVVLEQRLFHYVPCHSGTLWKCNEQRHRNVTQCLFVRKQTDRSRTSQMGAWTNWKLAIV